MLYRILAVLLFGVGGVASAAALLMIFAERDLLSRLLLILFTGAAFALVVGGRTCWRRGAR
jgi:hypothetical protein